MFGQKWVHEDMICAGETKGAKMPAKGIPADHSRTWILKAENKSGG